MFGRIGSKFMNYVMSDKTLISPFLIQYLHVKANSWI